MGPLEGRTWLEMLSPTECWRLLDEAPVGRVGVLVDGAPEIYPVNHVADQRTIVFRTDRGSKFRGLDQSPSVCFEVDAIDIETRTGWSVLVKGRAMRVTSVEDLRHARELPLKFWAMGEKQNWIRIVPASVTGRRIWPDRRPTEID